MADPSTFNLVVVTPEQTLFEGPVTKLVAPGIYQDIAILPNHTPLYAQLVSGELTLFLPDRTQSKIPLEGGIIRVRRNQVSIIVGFLETKAFTP